MKGGLKMKNRDYVKTLNLVLLGLVMLLPGLMKLFVMKPSAVTAMLTGLGFPIPMFFAWILILSEIIFGIAILARWRLKYTVWPPIIILVIAGLTTTISWQSLGTSQWPSFLLHIALASNYWLISQVVESR